jgi:hypothetical protein
MKILVGACDGSQAKELSARFKALDDSFMVIFTDWSSPLEALHP